MSSPSLSVVILLAGEESDGSSWASFLRHEDDAADSVILVSRDPESTAATADDVRGGVDRDLVHVNAAGLTEGAALNLGLDQIAADSDGHVLFLHSRMSYEPGTLRALRRARRGDPDLVIGRVISRAGADEGLAIGEAGQGRWLSSVDECPSLLDSLSPYGMAFRLSFIREHGLRFADRGPFVDMGLVPEAMLQAAGIVVDPQVAFDVAAEPPEPDEDEADEGLTSGDVWAVLDEVGRLLSVREGFDPARGRLAEDVALALHQRAFHEAVDVMAGEEARRYFVACARVLEGIPAESLVRASRTWRARRAYLAMVEQDWDRMALDAPSLDEATIRNGAIHYGEEIERPYLDEQTRPLSRGFWFRAWLGYFDVDDEGARFVGHLLVPDMAIQVPPSSFTPALRIGGETFRGEWDRRGDALASGNPKQEWSGFAVRVPAAASGIPSGRHPITFVLIAEAGSHHEVSCSLQANGGLLREARLIELTDRNIVPVTDESNWAELLVGPRHAVMNRTTWRVARARAALKAHQPFARLKAVATAMKLVPGRPVWLLAEREDTAQDNSAVFFRYLRTEHREVSAWYVIDRDAKQRARVADVGHVVDRGSAKHILLLLRAKVLVSGFDIDRYMLPPKWNPEIYRRHLAWFLGTPRVFLNHGVSYTDVSQVLARRYYGVALFVASGEREAAYTRDRMGYTHEVITTGLPRFDLLERRPVTPRRIVFMPTWRGYLKVGPPGSPEHAAFLASDYWRFISSVLESPRLRDLLERHDLLVEVYPHYEVAALLSSVVASDDRIVVADQAERAVREALAEASVFITDWTSVVFDAAYAGIPVIHAPFDREVFLTRHYRPGFFNFEEDGFGPVVMSPDDVVAEIERYSERDFVREDLYAQRADDFFSARGDHSRRVFEHIQEMLRNRR